MMFSTFCSHNDNDMVLILQVKAAKTWLDLRGSFCLMEVE